MTLNPRTPVLIGSGQVNQRDDADENVDPVGLMASAARRAGEPAVLRAVDSIRVVDLLSWRYRDPGLLLGAHIGAAEVSTRYSGVGGNVVFKDPLRKLCGAATTDLIPTLPTQLDDIPLSSRDRPSRIGL